MGNVFLKLVNMSIAAGWLVAVVLILRLLLKKSPKSMHCLLWALVGIRLIMPFSMESIFSLIPSTQTIQTSSYQGRPYIQSGVPVVDKPVNEYLAGHYYEGVTVPADNFSKIVTYVAVVWMVGMMLILAYGMISYVRLRRRVAVSMPSPESGSNIYYCDNIDTPFILGIWKPRIYLPSGMGKEQMKYVLLHENAHLRRKDHWWKLLGFVLHSVYWFHPLMWAAYLLLCRDIELACDEKAIRDMDNHDRKEYSEALLTCSVKGGRLVACPLAFGEVGVKDRIKSVLNYKKPAFWVIAVAAIACIVVALCFLTNPKSSVMQGDVVAAGEDSDSMEDLEGIRNATSPWLGKVESQGEVYCVGDAKYYVFMDSIEPICPCIELYEEDHSFSFTYSWFSSYLPIGRYELTDTALTLRTGDEDGGEVYVFDVKGDGFVFDASRSSTIPSYRYSGDSDELTCPVPDGAYFTPGEKRVVRSHVKSEFPESNTPPQAVENQN